MEFGAAVELEPGIEGLIHISEMSWSRGKVRKPSDVVKPGETVEAVILGVQPAERRISLGLKQALGDPWADAPQRFPVGSAIDGPVTSLTKFGAFVQMAEGVEGMVHVSEISAEKRINHPQDVLRQNQVVKALVLAVDREKRQLRLSIKQLVPSGLDEYIAEHKEGDIVSGRLIDASEGRGRVELGEGIQAKCRLTAANPDRPSTEARASNANAGKALEGGRSHQRGQARGDPPRPDPQIPHCEARPGRKDIGTGIVRVGTPSGSPEISFQPGPRSGGWFCRGSERDTQKHEDRAGRRLAQQRSA
jgi:small subunit ribosomal protein S1